MSRLLDKLFQDHLKVYFQYSLPLAPAAHGKDPGSGNTVVPDPGNVKGFGDPFTPVNDVTGFPKKKLQKVTEVTNANMFNH